MKSENPEICEESCPGKAGLGEKGFSTKQVDNMYYSMQTQ